MTRFGWIAGVLVLAGCAGSPPTRYFTLAAESPCSPASQPAHVDRLDSTVMRLPGVLDRPQLVVRTGLQTVDIREFDHWAEPLDQMATRVLVEDIARCQSVFGSGKSEYLLSVTVDEFMADTSGQAHLTGRWRALRKGEEISVSQGHSFSLYEKVDQVHGPEGAAAMSILLSRLAADILHGLPEK